MSELKRLSDIFEEYLSDQQLLAEPQGLYRPVNYIMSLGGKRIRPVMLLMANGAYGGKLSDALPAAYAVELFHNFSLVHDDIMDQAPLRRGAPAVHTKFGENAAILSGDVMMIYVYRALVTVPHTSLEKVLQVFNKAATEVCEGQQYDMEFEERDRVSVDEYLNMIRLKTAVLLAATFQLGGLLAGADDVEQKKLYDLGIDLGLAFQIQDDYLDTFGAAASVGKTIGGDIRQNKKTYLLNMAFEKADEATQAKLEALLNGADVELKVKGVTQLFRDLGIDEMARSAQQAYYEHAKQLLESLQITEEAKSPFKELMLMLFERES